MEGIPHCIADGVAEFHPGTNSNIQTAHNQRRTIDSPVAMEVIGFAHEYGINTRITVRSGNAAVSGTHKLRLALVTKFYNQYRGSAGQGQWWEDMIDLAPTSFGQAFSIATNDTVSFDFSFDWPLSLQGTPIPANNVGIVAYIQNDANREVIQACKADELSDPWPLLAVNYPRWIDDDQDHPNGRPDAGETVSLVIDLEAVEPYANCRNVEAVLRSSDRSLTITDNEGVWGTINSGAHVENTNDPFTIRIPANYNPHMVTFYLDVTATDFEETYEFTTKVGVPDILLVNDNGNGQNYVSTWQNIFTSMQFSADIATSLDANDVLLGNYRTVIWATGSSNANDEVITEAEAEAITQFLDNGGNVILTSQYAGETVGGEDWFNTYFGASHAIDGIPAPARNGVQGVENGGLPDALIAFDGYGGAGNYVSPSTMTTVNGGEGLYTYLNVDDLAGIIHQTDTYTAVYLGFPIEAITVQQGNDYQPAHRMMAEVIHLVDPEWEDVGDELVVVLPVDFGIQAFPNPFNSTVNLQYSLPENGTFTLEVLNLLGQRISLLEGGKSSAGQHSTLWNAGENPSGLYL
ncbi:hypothetical protein ACFLQJ_03275, partial [Calditrichota bacterium]